MTDNMSEYKETRTLISEIAMLWLKKDEKTIEIMSEVGECLYFNQDRPRALRAIMTFIRNEITTNTPAIENKIYAKLLEASLSRVDWYAVAEYLLENIE